MDKNKKRIVFVAGFWEKAVEENRRATMTNRVKLVFGRQSLYE